MDDNAQSLKDENRTPDIDPRKDAMSSRLITRLTAPVFAVSILLLGLGVGSAWYVHRLQKHTSDLLRDNVDSVLYGQKLEISIREVRAQFGRFLVDGDRAHLDHIETLREQTEFWIFRVKDASSTPYEHELVDRIWEGYQHFFEEYERSLQKPFNGDLYKEVSELLDPVLIDEILDPAHEYLALNEELLQQDSEANQAMAGWLQWALVLVGVSGAGGGLLVGLVMAWSYARRLVCVYVRLRDTADQLNDVVGPITLTAGQGLRDLDFDLQKLGEPVRKVIKRLQQSQREVVRAEQLAWVGQIAAGIAHEVRNPLTTLKILVQAASEAGSQGDSRSGGRGEGHLGGRDLQILEEEIGRLERLIGSFLEFARPPRTEKHPFQLRELMEQAMELVTPRAEAAGVGVLASIPKRPIVLEADRGQLHQVLFNLLLNAVQASELGRCVQLEAKVARTRKKRSRCLLIQVKDEGPGLPADMTEQIFEPFVSTKESGMGLGLSICRRIVEAHGGKISAENRPMGGAIFSVVLPLAPEDVALPTTESRQPAVAG